MSGKPITYWQDKWDTRFRPLGASRSDYVEGGQNQQYPEFLTICTLLHEYAGTSYSTLGGIRGGGSCSRFWAGRWNTSHGNEVAQTLREVADRGSPKGEQTVKNLMSVLAKNLKGKALSSEGDLSRILQVITEKTGVGFQEVQDTHHTASSPLLS